MNLKPSNAKKKTTKKVTLCHGETRTRTQNPGFLTPGPFFG
jgi:hypothetical protein